MEIVILKFEKSKDHLTPKKSKTDFGIPKISMLPWRALEKNFPILGTTEICRLPLTNNYTLCIYKTGRNGHLLIATL